MHRLLPCAIGEILGGRTQEESTADGEFEEVPAHELILARVVYPQGGAEVRRSACCGSKKSAPSGVVGPEPAKDDGAAGAAGGGGGATGGRANGHKLSHASGTRHRNQQQAADSTKRKNTLRHRYYDDSDFGGSSDLDDSSEDYDEDAESDSESEPGSIDEEIVLKMQQATELGVEFDDILLQAYPNYATRDIAAEREQRAKRRAEKAKELENKADEQARMLDTQQQSVGRHQEGEAEPDGAPPAALPDEKPWRKRRRGTVSACVKVEQDEEILEAPEAILRPNPIQHGDGPAALARSGWLPYGLRDDAPLFSCARFPTWKEFGQRYKAFQQVVKALYTPDVVAVLNRWPVEAFSTSTVNGAGGEQGGEQGGEPEVAFLHPGSTVKLRERAERRMGRVELALENDALQQVLEGDDATSSAKLVDEVDEGKGVLSAVEEERVFSALAKLQVVEDAFLSMKGPAGPSILRLLRFSIQKYQQWFGFQNDMPEEFLPRVKLFYEAFLEGMTATATNSTVATSQSKNTSAPPTGGGVTRAETSEEAILQSHIEEHSQVDVGNAYLSNLFRLLQARIVNESRGVWNATWRRYLTKILHKNQPSLWQKFRARYDLRQERRQRLMSGEVDEEQNIDITPTEPQLNTFLAEFEEMFFCPSGLALLMHTVFLAQKYSLVHRDANLYNEAGYLANVLGWILDLGSGNYQFDFLEETEFGSDVFKNYFADGEGEDHGNGSSSSYEEGLANVSERPAPGVSVSHFDLAADMASVNVNCKKNTASCDGLVFYGSYENWMAINYRGREEVYDPRKRDHFHREADFYRGDDVGHVGGEESFVEASDAAIRSDAGCPFSYLPSLRLLRKWILKGPRNRVSEADLRKWNSDQQLRLRHAVARARAQSELCPPFGEEREAFAEAESLLSAPLSFPGRDKNKDGKNRDDADEAHVAEQLRTDPIIKELFSTSFTRVENAYLMFLKQWHDQGGAVSSPSLQAALHGLDLDMGNRAESRSSTPLDTVHAEYYFAYKIYFRNTNWGRSSNVRLSWEDFFGIPQPDLAPEDNRVKLEIVSGDEEDHASTSSSASSSSRPQRASFYDAVAPWHSVNFTTTALLYESSHAERSRLYRETNPTTTDTSGTAGTLSRAKGGDQRKGGNGAPEEELHKRARAVFALGLLLAEDDFFHKADVVLGCEPFWLCALVWGVVHRNGRKEVPRFVLRLNMCSMLAYSKFFAADQHSRNIFGILNEMVYGVNKLSSSDLQVKTGS
eukprot:g12891.t1